MTFYTAGIVGFHGAQSEYDYELPTSGTKNVKNLTRNSNIGVTGIYVYKIDENRIRGISKTYTKLKYYILKTGV